MPPFLQSSPVLEKDQRHLELVSVLSGRVGTMSLCGSMTLSGALVVDLWGMVFAVMVPEVWCILSPPPDILM